MNSGGHQSSSPRPMPPLVRNKASPCEVATLAEALQHYNEAADAMIGHNEAKPLKLSSRELRQLEAFLKTLTAPTVPD